MVKRHNQKQVVLDAAARVVEETGAGHLTIDAVAQEAGLSKGGVLYHFPNKRALLEGMLSALIDGIDGRARAHVKTSSEAVNILRAMIRTESGQSDTERAMSRAILAAAAENPDLLAPARDYFGNVFDELRATSTALGQSSVAFLAFQGLVFLQMLDLCPMSSDEVAAAQEAMDQMAAEVRA